VPFFYAQFSTFANPEMLYCFSTRAREDVESALRSAGVPAPEKATKR
jgi:hypothetical protein